MNYSDRILQRAEETRVKLAMNKAAEAVKVNEQWKVNTLKNYRANNLIGQLSSRTGRIEENFSIDEVPFDIGYHHYDDGSYSIEWVAIGGVDIYQALPPDVKSKITSHVIELIEREITHG